MIDSVFEFFYPVSIFFMFVKIQLRGTFSIVVLSNDESKQYNFLEPVS